MKNDKRILYLDIIKIVSALMVILIHLMSIKWYVLDISDPNLMVLNILNALARVSVPMFVMISGAMLLGDQKHYTYAQLFKKYILRILVVYVVWSMIYAIISILPEITLYSGFELIKQFIYRTIQGPVHFWYLIMLVGLYLIIPFVNAIIKDRKLEEAFILIAIIFIILKSLKEVVVIDTIELYLLYLNFNFTVGYVVYFVLGHYIKSYTLSKLLKTIIYVLGVASFVFTFVMTWIFILDSKAVYDGFFGYLRPNILFSSIAMFVMLKDVLENLKLSEKVNRWIRFLSEHNFGVFISHLVFVNVVGQLGLMDANVPYLILLPLLTLLVYGLSVMTTFVIRKIPFLKGVV